MATINGSTNDNRWTFKLEVSEGKYDIEKNTSPVTVTMYLGRVSSRSYFGGNYTGNITIDGTAHSLSGSVPYPTYIDAGGWYAVDSWSKPVSHNNDGSKKVSVSASLTSNYFTPSSSSASGTVELTTIPRASDIAIANTDLGQNIPITIGKKVDTFTSTLSYTIGSLTGTIVDKTSLSNYPWVMTSTLINQIKNAYPSSGSYTKGGIEAKITCKTYNGTSLIGSKEATFKLYITDKPIISSATRTELNTNISALTTSVLRHVSQNKFTITATAPTGATIVSYRVRNGTQDSGTSTSNIVNLNDIQEYYEENSALKTKFIITCIDSRGNESAEYPVVCNFINYISISINKTDAKLKRSTSASTDCKLYATGNFYNGKFGNTSNVITFKYRYKLKTSSAWGNWITISASYTGNTFKINNQTISGTFDHTKNYDFELMATDKIGDTDSYSLVFATSVAIARCHKNGVDFVGLTVKENAVQSYMVGDLLLTTRNENPTVRFGGTWELYGKGRTLVCVDTSDPDFNTVKKTGGSKTHKLTIDEMPSHSHDMTDEIYGSNTNRMGVRTDGGGGTNWVPSYTQTNSHSTYKPTYTGGGKEHSIVQSYITCYIWIKVE